MILEGVYGQRHRQREKGKHGDSHAAGGTDGSRGRSNHTGGSSRLDRDAAHGQRLVRHGCVQRRDRRDPRAVRRIQERHQHRRLHSRVGADVEVDNQGAFEHVDDVDLRRLDPAQLCRVVLHAGRQLRSRNGIVEQLPERRALNGHSRRERRDERDRRRRRHGSGRRGRLHRKHADSGEVTEAAARRGVRDRASAVLAVQPEVGLAVRACSAGERSHVDAVAHRRARSVGRRRPQACNSFEALLVRSHAAQLRRARRERRLVAAGGTRTTESADTDAGAKRGRARVVGGAVARLGENQVGRLDARLTEGDDRAESQEEEDTHGGGYTLQRHNRHSSAVRRGVSKLDHGKVRL